MPLSRRALLSFSLSALTLAACGSPKPPPQPERVAGNTPQMNALIAKWARIHGIPASLLHRQIRKESGYNPAARNGPYYGLLQIHPRTAATMGYRGPAEGLLDAETNLQYAGKYLRGAWLVSRGDENRAMMWYAKGYYYEAKRMGLLKETGLRG